jgi:hypothetical protein
MGAKWQTLEGQLLDRVWFVPNGCWLKTTGLMWKGYGQINISGKNQRAHRVAYEYWVGPIPNSMLVCHSCDNRACIRPDHLFLGSPQDNTDDMMNKDRVQGQSCPHRKRWSTCKLCIKEYNKTYYKNKKEGK